MDPIYCSIELDLPKNGSSGSSPMPSDLLQLECNVLSTLRWLPIGLPLLCTPLYIYDWFHSRGGLRPLPWNHLVLAKFGVAFIAQLAATLHFICSVLGDNLSPTIALLYNVLLAIALLNIILLIWLCRRKGWTTSGTIFLTMLSMTLLYITDCCYHLTRLFQSSRLEASETLTSLFFLLFYAAVLTQLLLQFFVDKRLPYKNMDEEDLIPEFRVSFVNSITFVWMTSLIWQGWRRELDKNDVWKPTEEHRTAALIAPWKHQWNRLRTTAGNFGHNSRRLSAPGSPSAGSVNGKSTTTTKTRTEHFGNARSDPHDVPLVEKDTTILKNNQTAIDPEISFSSKTSFPTRSSSWSIVICIFRCFPRLIAYIVFIDFVSICVDYTLPQILKYIIRFVQDPRLPLHSGVVLGLALFTASMIYAVMRYQYWQSSQRLALSVKACLTASVYEKGLLLSKSARKATSVGEVVNVMSTDIERLASSLQFVPLFWSCIFQVIIGLYFLWDLVGSSALAGFLTMVAIIPLNVFTASLQQRVQKQQMRHKDERTKLMNEVLNGVKVLKLYAWEPAYEKKLLALRELEMAALRKYHLLEAVAMFIWISVPVMVAVATFTTFVLSSPSNILTEEVTFVSIALFNTLKHPIAFLPWIVKCYIEAHVSNKRILKFLNSEQVNSNNVSHDTCSEPITLTSASFAWDLDSEEGRLEDISLSVKPGELIAVVGLVGCGKSSLLNALLGEMHRTNGLANVLGSVAYVPQQAWILNASLKDNILFTTTADQMTAEQQELYGRVVSACSLEPDLKLLPAGDSTEIGEKGINLSGGQRQRVSLARAVFQNRDIYLLDDPLSAVDAHVGSELFRNVIGPKGLLKDKTRIFVTHGLQYLRYAHRIVVMERGKIVSICCFDQLGSQREFLANHLNKNAAAMPHRQPPGDSICEEDPIDGNANVEQPLKTCIEINGVPNRSWRSAALNFGSWMEWVHVHITPYTFSIQCFLPHTVPVVCNLVGISRDCYLTLIYTQQVKPKSRTSTSTSLVCRRRSVESLALSVRSSCMPEELTASKLNLSSAVPLQQLIETEKAEIGQVNLAVYIKYIRAVGCRLTVVILLFFALSQASLLYSNVWLSQWSDEVRRNESVVNPIGKLAVLSTLGFGQCLCALIAAITFAIGLVMASRHLHQRLVHNILRSPLSFFEVTPLGRILNRCSRDIESIDNQLPMNISEVITTLFNVVGTVLLICSTMPTILTLVAPTCIAFFVLQRFFIVACRQLKRIESASRSPIFSHFQESLLGATSIRAYQTSKQFISKSEALVDQSNMSFYVYLSCNRWVSVYLETLGSVIVFATALFSILDRYETTEQSVTGLTVSYALNIVWPLAWAVRTLADVEMSIIAVERVSEYTNTPTEASWTTQKPPPDDWPKRGSVEFSELSLRYRAGLAPALQNINCRIRSGEKIGIVGRTGAGKSSLTLSLFRIIEASEGGITIDGLKTSKVGLHELRRKLAIIPQEPVLFSGTIRSNLDPFLQHSDQELWNSLEHAHLKPFVSSLPNKLEHIIAEDGENLSSGQRQLICLARALLRKAKLLILDEATAAVDLATDELVQRTVKTEFNESTVLTIAHRLHTIMDSSRIMVLDSGRIIEIDTPENLLRSKDTVFYYMAHDAGIV